MALHFFPSKGITYDTCKQVAHVNQVVERFTLQEGYEKCVIVAVASDDEGYLYTMAGLESYILFTTRFIFDAGDSRLGFFADMSLPLWINADQVAKIYVRAQLTTELRRQEEAAAKRLLSKTAQVVEYSAKCLAIFTSEPADAAVLERINAKRNPSLAYQGRRVAGWVIPKCRQSQLTAVMTQV